MKTLTIDIRVNLRAVAKIVLLRHAHSSANSAGILSGQLPEISLSKDGLDQATALAERIGLSTFTSIRVSPMQRCDETIRPWITSAAPRSLKRYLIDDNLIEVDYGSWSGRKLSTLSREPLWKLIQSKPSRVKFPDGERIAAMQKRALRSIYSAYNSGKTGSHLFVSHGDVIKAIVAGLIKLPLDEFQSLVIDPSSITILDFDGEKARLLLFNDTTSHIEPYLAAPKRSRLQLGGGAGVTSKVER